MAVSRYPVCDWLLRHALVLELFLTRRRDGATRYLVLRELHTNSYRDGQSFLRRACLV
jgi:hypothetical protein